MLALLAPGCGNDDFANAPRPPAAIVVSAAILQRGVSVSPDRFGAGTITLKVTNQTASSQRLVLRSRGLASGGRAVDQSTGPINPSDTATLTADLDQGAYLVTASRGAIPPATIRVGARRRSAQNRLLQP